MDAKISDTPPRIEPVSAPNILIQDDGDGFEIAIFNDDHTQLLAKFKVESWEYRALIGIAEIALRVANRGWVSAYNAADELRAARTKGA